MSKRTYCYELACMVGTEEAAVIGQFYYWIEKYSKNPAKYKDNFRDGEWWVYNSTRKWHSEQFANMAKSTFDRTMKSLRDRGYLVKSEKDYNKKYKGKNSTSWYTVDLEKLHKDCPATIKDHPLLRVPKYADCTENENDPVPKTGTVCTENEYTECTENEYNNTLNLLPKIINNITLPNEGKHKLYDFLSRYLTEYRKRRGSDHPKVSEQTLKKAVNNIVESGAYNHTEIIPDYFNTEYQQGCDYRIAHFTNKSILSRRLSEIKPGGGSQSWRDISNVDDGERFMHYAVPALKQGIDIFNMSDSEYQSYIENNQPESLDYLEDRSLIRQCERVINEKTGKEIFNLSWWDASEDVAIEHGIDEGLPYINDGDEELPFS